MIYIYIYVYIYIYITFNYYYKAQALYHPQQAHQFPKISGRTEEFFCARRGEWFQNCVLSQNVLRINSSLVTEILLSVE